MTSIASRLIALTNWSDFRDISGVASRVPQSLTALLAAQDAKSAEAAYWGLENVVIAQGSPYSAIVPATRVLVAALLDDHVFAVRVSILDLLFQILSVNVEELPRETETDEELSREVESLVVECRRIASEGLWLIVREFVSGPRDAARDILECLGTNLDFDSLVDDSEQSAS